MAIDLNPGVYYKDQKGAIHNANHGFRYEVQLDNSAAAAVTVGQLVKIKNVAGQHGVPVVEACTAITDRPFGMVAYQNKQDTFAAGEILTIASDYTIITCEAAGAVNAGVDVMYAAAQKVDVAAGAGTYAIGTALTPAAADGDLIRVLLRKPEKLTA